MEPLLDKITVLAKVYGVEYAKATLDNDAVRVLRAERNLRAAIAALLTQYYPEKP